MCYAFLSHLLCRLFIFNMPPIHIYSAAYSHLHPPEAGGAGSVGRTAGHVRHLAISQFVLSDRDPLSELPTMLLTGRLTD